MYDTFKDPAAANGSAPPSPDDALVAAIVVLAQEFGDGAIGGAALQARLEVLAVKHGADLKRVQRLFDAEAKGLTAGGKGAERESQATTLARIASAVSLFHTPDGTAYADISIAGHRETWPTRSKGFRRWLARQFFEETGGAPNSEAVQSALCVIEARAHFDGPEREVHVRVAGHGEALYLDLADDEWRAVEVDAHGWRVVASPPVRFRRAAGMRPLPAPEPGGSVKLLRPFVNVANEPSFVLLVAYLLAALRNQGPYPILALVGLQGSAKSFVATLIRLLIDPNVAPLRSLPREDRDLFIAATNGHVVAFDNISTIPPWISDTMCRLATGGGFSARALYTDGDEALFDATRPVLLTGITDYIERSDLVDRSIFLPLEPIDEGWRRPEGELLAAFEAVRPKILGALLDAVAHGLKALPHTQLARMPRMADFALWATACEGALWPSGTFMAAYASNRADADATILENDTVARAVRELMAKRLRWQGTATGLHAELTERAGDAVTRGKDWPRAANTLVGRLKRVAPNLRHVGITVRFGSVGRGRDKRASITITCAPEDKGKRSPPSPPSPPSAPETKKTPYDINRLGDGCGVDRGVDPAADGVDPAADGVDPAADGVDRGVGDRPQD
ncbi:MAG: hypothetical protein ACREFA_17125, partial [Stellaceae bacterium]